MNKVFFRNNIKSYLLCSGLGIAAGLLVAFFSRFPADDLWAIALFSSSTFGFWIFSCSLIALFSERHYSAGINVTLYVYFMFYITGIFKRLAIVEKGYNTMSYFWDGLWQELAYGLLPALVCFALAFVLWYGRKKSKICVVLRFLPSLFIALEAAGCFVMVIIRGRGLFMTLVDSVSVFMFLFIVLKSSR